MLRQTFLAAPRLEGIQEEDEGENSKEPAPQQKKHRLAHCKVELGLKLQRNGNPQEFHQIFGIVSILRQEHQKV